MAKYYWDKYPHATPENDPAKKRLRAGLKIFFGKYCRFAIAPVYSRFDALAWFVWDAQTPDLYGDYDPVLGVEPGVVGIFNSFDEARDYCKKRI